MQLTIGSKPDHTVDDVAALAEERDLTLVVDGKSYRLLREYGSGHEEVIHVHRDEQPESWALDVLVDILEGYD